MISLHDGRVARHVVAAAEQVVGNQIVLAAGTFHHQVVGRCVAIDAQPAIGTAVQLSVTFTRRCRSNTPAGAAMPRK